MGRRLRVTYTNDYAADRVFKNVIGVHDVEDKLVIVCIDGIRCISCEAVKSLHWC